MEQVRSPGLVEISSSANHKIVWYFAKKLNNVQNYPDFLSSLELALSGKLKSHVQEHPIKFSLKLEATYKRPNVPNSSENRAFKTSVKKIYMDTKIETIVEESFMKLLAKEDAYVYRDIDNCGAIAKLLYERQLIDVFPNVYIALRLYLTIPLTNCEAERSFSKLALIKNRLRSTQIEDRLNALTIMSIENDICKKLSFHDTNNSIPNIEPGCNTIAFRNLINENEYVIIPTGTYELNQLESIIQKMMPDYVSMFELKANSRTLKCMISCSHDVDLGVENSIAKLLGFRNVRYTSGATHESENIVNIMKINFITGSFCDGAPSQIIHELYPAVPTGYKIVEVPRHPVFYGLNTTSITKNMDSYTLPCESYIFIEGKENKPANAVGEVRFSNNGLVFTFSEMRYEINGIEIQKLKSPGVASCLKAYCSYTPNDLNALDNVAWDSAMDSEDNKNFMTNNIFSGCFPLNYVFGFCEDYKKILLNCNQQLILNRASTDLDAIHVVGEGATAAVDKNKKLQLN
ncbi:hypothetical protein QTP88_017544 [Uroleucon formosanum]